MCRLNVPVDIFNANARRDVDRIRLRFPSVTDRQLDYLARRDWFETRDAPLYDRNNLFEVIQNMGYDGIFNYERYLKTGKDVVPSIGVFKKESIVPLKLLKKHNLVQELEAASKLERETIEGSIEARALQDGYLKMIGNEDQVVFIIKNIVTSNSSYAFGMTKDEMYQHLMDIYYENSGPKVLKEWQSIYRERGCNWPYNGMRDWREDE